MSAAPPPARVTRRRRAWTPAVVPIGLALVLLGLWAIFAPLTGPYFNYGFDTHTAWLASARQWELDLGPGIAIVLGGLAMLLPFRVPAWAAALLAAAGGIWLLVGPSVYPLWGTLLPPAGSTQLRLLKWIGYFYGTGALATYLAAFAQGMLSRSGGIERRASAAADEPVGRERDEVVRPVP